MSAIVRGCCDCGENPDITCYVNRGSIRLHFAGTTNVPNHWPGPYIGAYRVAVECTLPTIPDTEFNTASNAVIELVANDALPVAAGDELGSLPLCRVTGNMPAGLSFQSPSGDYYSMAGGDRSFWNGEAIVHRTTNFKVVGWNGYNTYGTTTPARDRTLLFGPRFQVDAWKFVWRATVTRNFESDHLYHRYDDGSEVRGDYYWTTISIEDEMTPHVATKSGVAWAYTYGNLGADEDVDLRNVLKPENPDWLRYYDPTGKGSAAQSSAYLNSIIPGMTTVATGLRATTFMEKVQSDYVEYVPTPTEPAPFTQTLVYAVTVDAVTGGRSFTGVPYSFVPGGQYIRAWPYVDDPVPGTYLLTDVSNTNHRQMQEYSAWDENGSRGTVRVTLEWTGIALTDAFRAANAGFGVNATGCHVEGTCAPCTEPCVGSVFVATTQPRQMNRWLDWGWWIQQRAKCPPEP